MRFFDDVLGGVGAAGGHLGLAEQRKRFVDRALQRPRCAGINGAGTAGDIARGRGTSYLHYSNENTYVAAVAAVAEVAIKVDLIDRPF